MEGGAVSCFYIEIRLIWDAFMLLLPPMQRVCVCVWALGFAAVFLLATNAKSLSLGVWMTPRGFEEVWALACFNWSRMLQSTWKTGALLSKGLWRGVCWGDSTAPSCFSHGLTGISMQKICSGQAGIKVERRIYCRLGAGSAGSPA